MLPVEDLHLAFASGTGNRVVLFGSRTGLDGIGGVSVLASETFDETDGGPRKLPSVQVGDPFAEKVLIECCLDLYRDDLVVGIQDLGGAGLSCATSELASAGDGGMHVELDTVPLRDSSLSPEEILMSESQERMMAVVEPEHLDAFKDDANLKPIIRVAAARGLAIMNKYYSRTDESEIYRISMSKCFACD